MEMRSINGYYPHGWVETLMFSAVCFLIFRTESELPTLEDCPGFLPGGPITPAAELLSRYLGRRQSHSSGLCSDTQDCLPFELIFWTPRSL